MPAAAQSNAPVQINRIDAVQLQVPIIGTAPLIVHKFSEKAKQQMLDAQQGVKKPKERRDPNSDYLAAFYRCKGSSDKPDEAGFRPGFPVIAFKAATVSAARFYGKEVTMTGLRQTMFFTGELSDIDNQQLVEIIGDPHMREDVVRVGMGGTDLRYRPEFTEWRTTLTVTFVKSALTEESVLSLIDAGGMGVGVGEWRPEKSGDFGTFQVDPTREVTYLS
jgi:hypothetical protein